MLNEEEKQVLVDQIRTFFEKNGKFNRNYLTKKNGFVCSEKQAKKSFGSWNNLIEKCALRIKFILRCDFCSKELDRYTDKRSLHNFCNHSCSASFTNSERIHKKETTEKISNSLKVYNSQFAKIIFLDNKICEECGELFWFNSNEKNRKICGLKCAAKMGGRAAVKLNTKRSKNEILFAELYTEHFGEEGLKFNEPIFDGYDCDLIDTKRKICVAWNGPFHYRKMFEKHSLEQTQNRDKYKKRLIEEKYGYDYYIIKDMGSHNPKFVNEQFQTFLSSLNNIN